MFPSSSNNNKPKSNSSRSDEAAELPVQHASWARRIAIGFVKRLAPGFDIDAVIQEATIAAWRKWTSWDPGKNDKFEGYAYLAVLGACKQAVRRKEWDAVMLREDLESLDQGARAAAGTPETVDDSIDRASAIAAVRGVLEQLQADERQVIELWIDGWQPYRIAFVMGRSEADVEADHARALQFLREKLRAFRGD